jgi:hypothetical protein
VSDAVRTVSDGAYQTKQVMQEALEVSSNLREEVKALRSRAQEFLDSVRSRAS